MNIVMILLSVALSSCAQLALKKGMLSVGFHLSLYEIIKAVAFNIYIFSGVSMHILALIVWLYVLKNVEVSYAYPFISLGFLVVLFTSVLFLGETISTYKVLGTLLICTGTALIALQKAH